MRQYNVIADKTYHNCSGKFWIYDLINIFVKFLLEKKKNEALLLSSAPNLVLEDKNKDDERLVLTATLVYFCSGRQANIKDDDQNWTTVSDEVS